MNDDDNLNNDNQIPLFNIDSSSSREKETTGSVDEVLHNNSSTSEISDDNIDVENDQKDNDEDFKPSRRGVMIFGLSSIIAAIPLGLGVGYLLKTKTQTDDANKALSNINSSRGSISPVNTKTKVFKGQTLENVNVEQKSLVGGSDNTADEAAVFIFNNGKNGEKKILDIYLDFDAQVSRDFMLINQISLKSLVESGLIELRVHPVSSGTPLSIYSPEAVAESFVVDPAKSWTFLISVMKLSAELQNNSKLEPLPSLAKKAEELEIKGITEETISNGTFSSWIIEVGNDAKLKTGYYPPIIYVNDVVVDPDKVDFNDTTALQNYILKQE